MTLTRSQWLGIWSSAVLMAAVISVWMALDPPSLPWAVTALALTILAAVLDIASRVTGKAGDSR